MRSCADEYDSHAFTPSGENRNSEREKGIFIFLNTRERENWGYDTGVYIFKRYVVEPELRWIFY